MAEVRDPGEEDFAEEIRSHLAHETDRLIATGMAPVDAEAAARRRFGNVTRTTEQRHESRRPFVDLGRLRLAVRRLRRAPLFALTVVTMLGLAVAVATLVFGAVYSVAWRPLPFRDAGTLMQVWQADDIRLGLKSEDVFDRDVLRAWLTGQSSFSEFTAYSETSLAPRPRIARAFAAARVDGRFFATLGIGMVLGRPITAIDDDAASPPVIVLSDQLWRRAFRAEPTVVGTTWRLNTTTYTIVGVATPSGDIPGGEAWISAPGRATDAGTDYYYGIARLKRGVSVETAQAQLASLLPRAADAPSDAPQRGALLIPLARSLRRISPTLMLVIAAVALLLAVAIANLGTVFLVRTLGRLKQTAISTALGATAARIRIDTAIEGMVLGAIGAALGIALMIWLRFGLQRFLSEQITQRSGMLPLDLPVIAFGVLFGVAIGIVLAVLPERIARRGDLTNYLHGGGAGAGIDRAQSRWRRGLVGLQVASAVIAAVTAAALLRSSQYMAHVDLGYDASRVVVAPLELANSEYHSDTAAHLLADRIDADLSHAPGLAAPAIWASIGFPMPKFPGDVMTTAEGSALRMDTRHCNWSNCAFVVHPVTDNLFTTFGVAMKAGRDFDASDRAGNTPVVVINERAAQVWWPGEDGIGKRIRIGSAASGQPWRTVVGIVANFAPLDGMGLLERAIKTSNIQPMIYEPLAQSDLIGPLAGGGEIFVALRAPNAPQATAAALQRRLAALIPDIEVPAARSMQEYLQSDYIAAELQLHTLIAVAVTIATLLLAILGIAGVVVESVRYRTRELGVRLALGATRSSIVRLICGSALQWLGAGVAAGVIATFLLDRTIARVVFVATQSFPNGLLLFGPRHHAVTLIVSAASVVAVGLAAAYLPARLASRLDPLIALRSGNE